MNKQINELIEQAEAWVCKNYPDAMDDNDEFHAQTMHKFAELLIRECSSLAYDGPGGILEHFGIDDEFTN